MARTFIVFNAGQVDGHTPGTGHTDRLGRDLTGRYNENAYAVEELIAAFTCAILGISPTPTTRPRPIPRPVAQRTPHRSQSTPRHRRESPSRHRPPHRTYRNFAKQSTITVTVTKLFKNCKRIEIGSDTAKSLRTFAKWLKMTAQGRVARTSCIGSCLLNALALAGAFCLSRDDRPEAVGEPVPHERTVVCSGHVLKSGIDGLT